MALVVIVERAQGGGAQVVGALSVWPGETSVLRASTWSLTATTFTSWSAVQGAATLQCTKLPSGLPSPRLAGVSLTAGSAQSMAAA